MAETQTPDQLDAELDSLAAEAVRQLSDERPEELLADRRRRDIGSPPRSWWCSAATRSRGTSWVIA